jgi:hypothetical protein
MGAARDGRAEDAMCIQSMSKFYGYVGKEAYGGDLLSIFVVQYMIKRASRIASSVAYTSLQHWR